MWEKEAAAHRILQAHTADECCSDHIVPALDSGSLDEAESWICPDCGMGWKPKIYNECVRMWEPHPVITVLRA